MWIKKLERKFLVVRVDDRDDLLTFLIETVLTNEIDWCIAESIDYLIFVNTKENKQNKLVYPSSTKLEEFFSPSHPIVSQLSDHYGVSTVLKVDY